MDDAEALSGMLSAKVDPRMFESKFSRPTGPADLGGGSPRTGDGKDRTRGDNQAMQDSTMAGLRAMLRETAEEEAPRPVSRPRPRPASPHIRETRPAPKASSSLLESGDILQNTAFNFMVTVQELTEDGGFLGRGAGVGRIRVRGSEMGLYKRVGKGV